MHNGYTLDAVFSWRRELSNELRGEVFGHKFVHGAEDRGAEGSSSASRVITKSIEFYKHTCKEISMTPGQIIIVASSPIDNQGLRAKKGRKLLIYLSSDEASAGFLQQGL